MSAYSYQLRDIHGLDSIPIWPPAWGWWLVLLAVFIGLWLGWRLITRWRMNAELNPAWRWDARRQLKALRRRVAHQSVAQSSRELSELLRRIAMARHGRAACAGLAGEAWLTWLEQHDPQGYAWRAHGQLLVSAPYAPPAQIHAEIKQVLELIHASHYWIQRRPHLRTLKTHV